MSLVRNVCNALERIAPLRLAEKWDNVGLIWEAPLPRKQANRILLTIDLTSTVVQEAIDTPTAVIISYHPPIFKPLSSFTLSNPIQKSLLLCAAHGISVFSPHTALDSVNGGINDWLTYILVDGNPLSFEKSYVGVEKEGGIGGEGRLIRFHTEIGMDILIARIKTRLKLEKVQVAYSASRDLQKVKSVAICAGSGGSMLLGVDADVYFTGEMSHLRIRTNIFMHQHEVLAAAASGHNIILCGHTNTERGYLPILADKLLDELRNGDATGGAFGTRSMEVHISAEDKHPLFMV